MVWEVAGNFPGLDFKPLSIGWTLPGGCCVVKRNQSSTCIYIIHIYVYNVYPISIIICIDFVDNKHYIRLMLAFMWHWLKHAGIENQDRSKTIYSLQENHLLSMLWFLQCETLQWILMALQSNEMQCTMYSPEWNNSLTLMGSKGCQVIITHWSKNQTYWWPIICRIYMVMFRKDIWSKAEVQNFNALVRDSWQRLRRLIPGFG